MMHLGLLFVATFGMLAVQVAAQHHVTMMCLSCDNIKDPRDCTRLVKCGHEERCFTAVTQSSSGESLYTLSCAPRQQCDNLDLIGRREIQCKECCGFAGCNRDLCDGYQSTTAMPMTTTMAASTTSSAGAMTTAGGCRDHEEDGFSCSHYDVYNFCSATTGIAFVVAHEKCPAFCGFCDGGATSMQTTAMTMEPGTDQTTPNQGTTISATPSIDTMTTQADCKDIEDPNFKCSDHMDLCIDNSPFAVQLAKDRCPRFCGLCGITATSTTAAMTSSMTSSTAGQSATMTVSTGGFTIS